MALIVCFSQKETSNLTAYFVLGNLIQVTENRKGKTFGGLSLKSSEGRKETVRQCFLFSGFLLLTTRSSSGRLHLTKVQLNAPMG